MEANQPGVVPHRNSSLARLFAVAWIALAAVVVAGFAAQTVTRAAAPRVDAQATVDGAVTQALQQFRAENLTPEQVAVSVIDLADPAHPVRAAYRGDAPIYPASVVKLFYLVATQAWLEAGKLQDTPELRRAMRDMIVDSSNDATSYLIDLLTGTTSGPELPEAELVRWFEQRNAVNRYFADLGYTRINANKKPWGDGPYGRETQAAQKFEPRRNALTTDATARLLADIVTHRVVSAARCDQMMALLARDSAKPDEQAQFIASVLPAGAKQWSKAGWTSQTRHHAAYVELPNGAKFVLVIFTTDHAGNPAILQAIAKPIIDAWAAGANAR